MNDLKKKAVSLQQIIQKQWISEELFFKRIPQNIKVEKF